MNIPWLYQILFVYLYCKKVINQTKIPTVMKPNASKVSVFKVPSEYVKVVKSANGALSFVDRHVALRRGQLANLNFRVVHPLNRNYVQFNGIVECI